MVTDEFKDKVVVVTGAAQGIGRNIGWSFARAGALVVIVDNDQSHGEATARSFSAEGHSAEYVNLDLRQAGVGQALARIVQSKYGQWDVLINNARSKIRTSINDETEDSWNEAMAVNARAPFFLSQAAIPLLKKSTVASIVNISSVAAALACYESPTYHASKAALLQLTRYVAQHVGAAGIRVNCVVPGWITKDENIEQHEGLDNERYRMVAEFCHPVGRTGRSDDVAKTVMYLCSQDAGFITGQAIVIDGGLIIQEPSSLVMRFSKKTD